MCAICPAHHMPLEAQSQKGSTTGFDPRLVLHFICFSLGSPYLKWSYPSACTAQRRLSPCRKMFQMKAVNRNEIYILSFANYSYNFILAEAGFGVLLSPRGLQGPRPGSTDDVRGRAGPGSGLVQITAIRLCIEHFGLSRTILFSQIKSYS
jgi:hypothetical protein